MHCQFYANEKLFKSLVLQWCNPRATECPIRASCESNSVGLGEQNSKRNRHKTPPKLTSEAFIGTSDHLCFKILHVLPLLKHATHSGRLESLSPTGTFPSPCVSWASHVLAGSSLLPLQHFIPPSWKGKHEKKQNQFELHMTEACSIITSLLVTQPIKHKLSGQK